MKKYTIIFALILFASTAFSQQKSTSGKRITENDLHKVEKKESSSTQAEAQSISFKSWTLSECESYLDALDTKEAKIKSDPEQFAIAKKEGWFIEAEKNRKQVKARIEELK